jgi:hypothetical protein
MPLQVDHFFDGHGGRGRLALIILEPRPFLFLRNGPHAESDLLFCLVQLDDLEIEFLPNRQRRLILAAARPGNL